MVRHYRSLIDECLAEECDGQHYCLLKEIVLSSQKFDPRFLVQMKCVEIHKWHMGQRVKRDVSWDAALMAWNDEGLAKIFADLWPDNTETTPQSLYKMVLHVKS